MKYKLLLLLFVGVFNTIAQTSVLADPLNDTTKKVENPWKFKSIFGLNGSQTSFVNWAAGGRNNVSVLGFIDASLKYNKQHVKWDNDLKFALGGLKYIDSTGKQQGMQKSKQLNAKQTFQFLHFSTQMVF